MSAPGRYGQFGGQFLPETLMPAVAELEAAFEAARADEAFQQEWARQDLELAPGLTITYGDAVAMGDYFGSFKSMQDLARIPGKGIGTRGEVMYVLWAKIWGNKKDNWDFYDTNAKRRANQLIDQSRP